MEKQDLEYWRELAIRNQADLENARKRFQKELAQSRERTLAQIIKELFATIDTLQYSVDHNVEGAEFVSFQLHAALGNLGVEAYDPTGEIFDPRLHEAVSVQKAEAETEDGTILTCLQRGYSLKDSNLRPARVVVAGGG
jgi:molecular chaperone GrpE